MSRSETRRTVSAENAGEEVLVREAVVGSAEERDQYAFVLVRSRQRGAGRRSRAQIVDAKRVGDEALSAGVKAAVVEMRVLITANDLELVPCPKVWREGE